MDIRKKGTYKNNQIMAGDKEYDDVADDHICDEYYDSHDDDANDDTYDDSGMEDNADPLGAAAAPWRPCTRWQLIRIGEAVLDVSSDGRVKAFGQEPQFGLALAHEGFVLQGTPFRTYTVEIEPGQHKMYYMHDLVYYAFNGPPPEGYVVRHVPAHTSRARKVYSNRLGCLTVVPNNVSPLRLGAAAFT
jgi:hypothetical protein